MFVATDTAKVTPNAATLTTRLALTFPPGGGKYVEDTNRLQLPVPLVAERVDASQAGKSTYRANKVVHKFRA